MTDTHKSSEERVVDALLRDLRERGLNLSDRDAPSHQAIRRAWVEIVARAR